MQSFGGMQSMASGLFSTYASVAASMMLFRTMFHDVIPEPVKSFISTTLADLFKRLLGRFYSKLSTHMTIVVDEQSGISRNQLYDAADVYLRTIINPNTERLRANKTHKQKSIGLSMEKEHEVVDTFNGIQVNWQFVLVEPDREKSRYQPEKRFYELTFEKPAKDTVVNEYLPFVLKRAKEIKDNEKSVKLFTRDCPFSDDDDEGGNGRGGYWGCMNLDHPLTFDKLAMDPQLKKSIIEDLDRFVRRRDYYKKVGKAWKRGYLLYGPPGTGKSSLIAAMANYLRFDVYDLELSSIYSNSDLRRTLLCTNNRSIIVIEDIDCSAEMHDRAADSDSDDDQDNTKFTLSGMLNFIDGLWSSCGDERIIIFTTNHKEKLDPALLRPGRMDMHIYMGYCTPEAFDVLAFNYLGINDHPRLFPEIKGLIREVEISPAEVAEHLMRNEEADLALQGVIDLLKQKKEEKCTKQEAKSDDKKEKDDKEKKDVVVASEEKKKKGKLGKLVKRIVNYRKKSNADGKS